MKTLTRGEVSKTSRELFFFNVMNITVTLIELGPISVFLCWQFFQPGGCPHSLVMLGGWLTKVSAGLDSLFLHRFTAATMRKKRKAMRVRAQERWKRTKRKDSDEGRVRRATFEPLGVPLRVVGKRSATVAPIVDDAVPPTAWALDTQGNG